MTKKFVAVLESRSLQRLNSVAINQNLNQVVQVSLNFSAIRCQFYTVLLLDQPKFTERILDKSILQQPHPAIPVLGKLPFEVSISNKSAIWINFDTLASNYYLST